MQTGAHAYARTAHAVSNPRDLEAQLLLKAAAGIQTAIDSKVADPRQAINAINYNLKVWKLFSTAATDPKNPLPADVKQNVSNLGVFVMGHSLSQLSLSTIEPEELRILVKINSDLAAGLRGSGAY
jgi:flagellar biosynthesis activator protein FlaF